MPKFPRRRLGKLSKQEQAKNKDLTVKCSETKVPLPGRPKWRLKECEHSDFPELEISPLWYCVQCIWESLDTDTEYDPGHDYDDEYDSDFYNDNKNK